MAERSWALFLDLDGTLIDIAARPASVVVPEGLLASLEAAREALDGALAIVTGRPIADLDRILQPLRLAAAGQHGAELRLSPDAAVMQLSSKPIGEEIRRAVVEAAEAQGGIELEDKGQSLAIHYRVNPAAGEPLRRRICEILATADEKLMLASGKMVLEIRDPRFTKAGAVDALMGDPVFAGRIPTYIGDDETDKDGIAAAERRGGLGLRVGGADGAFARPADLRAWLADLPERLAGCGWP